MFQPKKFPKTEFNALIAIPRAGAIKCCIEIKITVPLNEWHNIPLQAGPNIVLPNAKK